MIKTKKNAQNLENKFLMVKLTEFYLFILPKEGLICDVVTVYKYSHREEQRDI